MANFGPISADNSPSFYVTAIDNAPNPNAADSQIFSVDIQS